MLDQPHYERLRRAMSDSAQERDRFQQSVEEVAGAATDSEHFATVRMRDNGDCVFLDDDRLCYVQRRYGEELLGNMCSLYPRDSALVHDRVEVTGTLSCPEVARQCLLPEDAMEMGDHDPRLLPRQHFLRRLDSDPEDPYTQHFDLIRHAMISLLSATRYPLASRLFFIVYLGEKTASFLGRGKEPASEHRLAEELERMERRVVLDELHRQFQSIAIPTSWALGLIRVIVQARLQVHIPGFHQLVADGLAGYAQPASTPAAGSAAISVTQERIWPEYQRRRGYWTTTLGWRIDQMFSNYCQNYWLREWYVASPNLLVHSQKLLVRLAVLRFLLFSHPRLQELYVSDSGKEVSAEEGKHAMETTAVEVFYTVLRALEHDPLFLDNVQNALQAEGAYSLAHIMFLLKF